MPGTGTIDTTEIDDAWFWHIWVDGQVWFCDDCWQGGICWRELRSYWGRNVEPTLPVEMSTCSNEPAYLPLEAEPEDWEDPNRLEYWRCFPYGVGKNWISNSIMFPWLRTRARASERTRTREN